MIKNLEKIILRPVISEKTTLLKEKINVYCFEVDKNATKHEIKNTVNKLYNVNVEKVNIVNVKGKIKKKRFMEGKRKDWKKAYVKIKKGEKITIFEGV